MLIKERVTRKKNFLPAVVVTIFLVLSWLIFFFFIPPEYLFMPMAFLGITFLMIFLGSALIFANTRRGLLLSSGVIILMLLRYFEIGNYLNIVLLGGALLSTEYYFARKHN